MAEHGVITEVLDEKWQSLLFMWVSYLWEIINRKLISVLDAREHIDTVVSILLFSLFFFVLRLKICDENRGKK